MKGCSVEGCLGACSRDYLVASQYGAERIAGRTLQASRPVMSVKFWMGRLPNRQKSKGGTNENDRQEDRTDART